MRATGSRPKIENRVQVPESDPRIRIAPRVRTIQTNPAGAARICRARIGW